MLYNGFILQIHMCKTPYNNSLETETIVWQLLDNGFLLQMLE